MSIELKRGSYIASAKRVLEIEAGAIKNIVSAIDESFCKAVELILECKGRVVLVGVGKSGLIGKKISATLASTGTPSFFLHPTEAFHGDLGMVMEDDLVLALSNSGETFEVLQLLPFFESNKNKVVSFCGNRSSSLAKGSKVSLKVDCDIEACPLQLAPTASTTATLALGDALAVALMEAREFQPANFAKFHPGGSLGKKLLMNVEHQMKTEELPIVRSDTTALGVIEAITRGKLGIAIVESDSGFGLITDGDLRRLVQRDRRNFLDVSAVDFMSIDPIFVPIGTRVVTALDIMEKRKIGVLLVTKGDLLVGVFQK